MRKSGTREVRLNIDIFKRGRAARKRRGKMEDKIAEGTAKVNKGEGPQ